jgi:hypothetical protein
MDWADGFVLFFDASTTVTEIYQGSPFGELGLGDDSGQWKAVLPVELTVAYADERREESHSEVSLAVELFWARDGASWERAASSATEEKRELGILNLLNANVW